VPKLSFNLSATELGHIDLLVAQGLYTNRTDVIRAALRHLFEVHGDVVKRAVQGSTGTGHFVIRRESLERSRDRGERQIIDVVGVLEIADDVTPALADAAIESIQIYGVFTAPEDVKHQLADRTRTGAPTRRAAAHRGQSTLIRSGPE
jgi:Arc/MetJ-type ribon-helix-helix transcriptional regulator